MSNNIYILVILLAIIYYISRDKLENFVDYSLSEPLLTTTATSVPQGSTVPTGVTITAPTVQIKSNNLSKFIYKLVLYLIFLSMGTLLGFFLAKKILKCPVCPEADSVTN